MTIPKLLLLVTIASFAIAACDTNDGMAEKAGEEIDKAATDVGNAVEDACEDVKEGAGAKDTDC